MYAFYVSFYHHRVELATKLRQFETLEIVNSLLDSIISSVVGMSNGEEREVVSADHFQNSGDTTDEVVVEDMESLIHSGKFLIEVTDDERESEGNIRLQILLCLLDLACAMVSFESMPPHCLWNCHMKECVDKAQEVITHSCILKCVYHKAQPHGMIKHSVRVFMIAL